MATKKPNEEVKVDGVVKRKSNGKNSPVIGDNGLQVEPGDNAKYLGVSLRLAELPKIDMMDAVAVEARLKEFFAIHIDADMKPTVAGMGLALNGIDRRRLWEIKTNTPSTTVEINNLPPAVKDAIKKAYYLMENLWENYMQNGKINPVSGIFLGKNNYGYQDKTEYVLTPNSQNEPYSAEDIKSRYVIEDHSDSDSENED